ncbi:MAG: Transport-associated protein [Bacteriovoracaceae bacterium]|nr:Transport-associated protein [Bacteriovoracaceae bacterium]
MKTDAEISKQVIDEFQFDPILRDREIGVSVKDGVATLTGKVDSYYEKRLAEKVVERVPGIKAIANELEVRLPFENERSDTDIAHAAISALKWNILVPEDKIKVKVENGWVTLEGETTWNFEKDEAEQTVASLTGVKGVINLIEIRSSVSSTKVKEKVEEAIKHRAELDAKNIEVSTEGSKIILRGKVSSYIERVEAERAAWSIAGVTDVEDELDIDVAA